MNNKNFIGIRLISSLRFNCTLNTILVRTSGVKAVYFLQTDGLSGNHKTKSAALFRLITQTIQVPKKRNRTVSN